MEAGVLHGHAIGAPAGQQSHLEEELELLSLGPLQDLRLQVPEDGHARVHLVVSAHQHARRQVLADFPPVQVVPEALG